MLRKFKPVPIPYDPMSYQGIKRFKPDAQPHSQRCVCSACKQYLKVISQLAPARIELDDDGNPYVMSAEKRDKPTRGLTWNDPNRPYQLAQGNRSSATWRGGVFTQVRTAPAPAPAPVSDPVPLPKRAPAQTRVNVSPRQARYNARMARYEARQAKQVVTSVNTRVTLTAQSFKRNGQVIVQQSRDAELVTHVTSVVQHTSKPKNASRENVSTLVAHK